MSDIETSKLAVNNGSEHDNRDITNALSRLKEEANQAMAYGNRSLRDVTKDFTTASTQLVRGQLVKDEYFTLFEAVGALEVSEKFAFESHFHGSSIRILLRPYKSPGERTLC